MFLSSLRPGLVSRTWMVSCPRAVTLAWPAAIFVWLGPSQVIVSMPGPGGMNGIAQPRWLSIAPIRESGHECPREVLSAAIAALRVTPGLTPTRTLPFASPATHSAVEGHETEVRGPTGSIRVMVHAARPPDGSVELATSPLWSSATHSSADGHEIWLSPETAVRWTTFHARLMSVGLVDVRMFPSPSAATQSLLEARAIASS